MQLACLNCKNPTLIFEEVLDPESAIQRTGSPSIPRRLAPERIVPRLRDWRVCYYLKS